MKHATCGLCGREGVQCVLVRSTTGRIAWECPTCANADQAEPRASASVTDYVPLGRLRDGTMAEQAVVHPLADSAKQARRDASTAQERLSAAIANRFDPRKPFALDPAHYAQEWCTSPYCQRLHVADQYAHNSHLAMLLHSAFTPVQDVQPAPEAPRAGTPVGATDPTSREANAPAQTPSGTYRLPQANYVAAGSNYRQRGGRKARAQDEQDGRDDADLLDATEEQAFAGLSQAIREGV